MAGEVKFDGAEAVLKKLRTLKDPKRQKSAVRNASTRALKVVRDAARAKARTFDDSRSPERVDKNIVTRYRARRSKGDNVVTSVGVLGGARDMSAYGEIKGKGGGNPGGDTWYWRFKEFGVPEHGIAAEPFMRPALENNTQKVADTFTAEMNRQIDKAVQKGH